jgi:predicted permease
VLGTETVREWQYGSLQAPLLMLLGAAAFVLLIACVNIANLTSAQSIARSGELTLRLALGASTSDVLRLHLLELLIVCVCGLVPGVLVAWLAVPALLSIDPTIARTLGAVSIDWRVQAFSAALAILTAVAAAAIPAIRAMRGDISTLVSAAGLRTTGAPGQVRARRVLVSTEVALCVALLMAGGVLIQGLRDLSERSPGYEQSGVMTAQIRLPEAAYKSPAQRALVVQSMLDGIRAIPGVSSAAITQNAFVPGFSYQTLIHIKERPTEDGQPHTVQFRRVSPGYFETMQIRLVQGRGFVDADVAEGLQVAVVSRRFADRLFPGMDPIGRIVMRTGSNPPVTIVGVADDVADVSVTQPPEATLYLPWAQNNNFGVPVALVIRTGGDPASVLPAVREAVRAVDPSLPLRRAQPLDVFVQESTAPERFRTVVMGLVASLGLLLALVGISGVTARGVVDRTREFAVRLALGSGSAAVVRLVIVQSMRDLGIGVIAGVTAGVGVCAWLAATMQNVGAVSAVTTGASVALIGLTGLVAVLLPAMRILRVRPAEILRS